MTSSTTDATASIGLPYRVLSLDGGGAKGFYTIGILDELEKNLGKQIHEVFDLIFGTSTGAIIAALLARGDTVSTVLDLYREYVPTIMAESTPARQRSPELSHLCSFKLSHLCTG